MNYTVKLKGRRNERCAKDFDNEKEARRYAEKLATLKKYAYDRLFTRTEEINYFNSTDPYEVAKTALRQYSERYSTTFNKHLGFCSDGNIFAYEDGEGEDVKKHNISIIEISEMLKKYRLLEKVDKLLTEGIGYHDISKTVDLVAEQNQIDMEVK